MTIFTSSDFISLTLSSLKIIAVATIYGEYTSLFFPFILFVSYLLFLELKTIFKCPVFPSNSEFLISLLSK